MANNHLQLGIVQAAIRGWAAEQPWVTSSAPYDHWPRELTVAILEALNEGSNLKEVLGPFTRCSGPRCKNGEFFNKAVERGWAKYANCLFCPDHKE